MPVLPVVAIAVAPLLQAPPVVASLSAVVVPVHRLAVPDMAVGKGFTVTVAVAAQPVSDEV